MLVLETIFEHGQPIFLLVALALDEDFLPHIAVVLHKLDVVSFFRKSNVVSINTFHARAEDLHRDPNDLVPLPRV